MVYYFFESRNGCKSIWRVPEIKEEEFYAKERLWFGPKTSSYRVGRE